jgi:DNA-binding transcriptional ArsR family regulator
MEQERHMSCDGSTEKGDLAVMATLIGGFWIKNMRRNCLLFDNDLTLAYILGEIGMYNVSHMHAQPAKCAALPVHLDAGTLHDVLKPCNAYSIAEATGLPRETVRRKIVRLEELGWVRRLPEGGVIVSARCIEHTYSEAYPEVFFDLLDTVKHLRRHLPQQWFE